MYYETIQQLGALFASASGRAFCWVCKSHDIADLILCIKYYAVRLKRKKDRSARASGEKKVKKQKKVRLLFAILFAWRTFFMCDPENERFCSITEKWKKILVYYH